VAARCHRARYLAAGPRPGRQPPAARRCPAAAGSPWRVQQTPNPIIPNGVLDAVSCASPGTCIAVGTIGGQSMITVTLALRTG
jgi:hypothetical protein